MIANSVIQIRTPKIKKAKVQKILKREGLTFSSLFNLFLEDIIDRDDIPLKVSYKPNKETIKAIKEAHSGKGLEKFNTIDDLIDSLE